MAGAKLAAVSAGVNAPDNRVHSATTMTTLAPISVPSIADRAFWESLSTRPQNRPLLEHIEKIRADLPDRPTMPNATDYLAAKRSNDRARIDRLWQQGRANLSALAIHRCIKGLDPNDLDDRLLDWLWAFLMHPTWTVSAHLPNNDLPASARPVLDLASCEMAAVMAEMREGLKPWMDSVSGTLSDSVVYEIDRRVLTPYAEGFEVWWDKRDRLNNWLGVCAGNILAACESLAAQGHPRPKARRRALEGLRLFFDAAFTEHGECDEGLGYWSYGVGQAVVGLSRLSRREMEAAVDMDRFRLIADYPRRIHLHGDVFFSGNDGSLHGKAPMSFVPWLAEATQSDWLGQWAARSSAIDGRNFPMLFRGLIGAVGGAVATAPAAEATPTRNETSQFLPDQQVAILRHNTTRGQLIIALSGGHNAERHNHNDLGHFLVALDEQVIIPDLGAPQYTADFFGPRRYSYLAASSRGHNCPLIDDVEQRPGREALGKILEWSEKAGEEKLILNLTSAYPPEAGLANWIRSLERVRDGFLIRDQFRARPGAAITHIIWSTQPASLHPDSFADLGSLRCSLSPQTQDVQVEQVDPKTHRLRDYTAPLYRLAARYIADASGALTVESRFTVP